MKLQKLVSITRIPPNKLYFAFFVIIEKQFSAAPNNSITYCSVLDSYEFPALLKKANTPNPVTSAAPAATVLYAEAHESDWA